MARNPQIVVGHNFHGIHIQNAEDYKSLVANEMMIDELTEKIHATDPLQWKERLLMTNKRRQKCEDIMRYILGHYKYISCTPKGKVQYTSYYHCHKAYMQSLCEKCGIEVQTFIKNYYDVND